MTKPSRIVATTEKTPEEMDALHHDCFACGIGNQNGLNLHFEVGEDGVATADWQPSKAFRSYPDRVHGGVIATLLDSAIVHALFAIFEAPSILFPHTIVLKTIPTPWQQKPPKKNDHTHNSC